MIKKSGYLILLITGIITAYDNYKVNLIGNWNFCYNVLLW